ncbi:MULTISPECIES: hypothetical protein [unclassified Chelatococcus]|uniref:hypothetical protein n=1 Tax=unclassified Chelatococcus TaxID=2638111 RepID=UPI001BCD3C57|nr:MULTISPECIES: hypothetical protein [unclassified Chelatococcus]MBS7737802.1 hypothetical protein [Chelatococcus sp. HY11]MCO5079258.1 hypothetical protein [Chelatococcus sp.]CAH1665973.1 hypothetical protein CHELA41_22753 [Hyphomicrobiales bacterium]CAH1680984.1 hypothetical protein CHELA20_52167 [Hyphomicrobiales bacterium]
MTDTVRTFCVFDDVQRDAVVELNDPLTFLDPRLINNPYAPVEVQGKYAANANVMNDPAFARFLPVLEAVPRMILDSDMLFSPIPD